jgi:hypothetical protein
MSRPTGAHIAQNGAPKDRPKKRKLGSGDVACGGEQLIWPSIAPPILKVSGIHAVFLAGKR